MADEEGHSLADPPAKTIAYLRLEYPFNEPQCLWLTFFVVAPKQRGRGYGRRIMALLTSKAQYSPCVERFGVHTMTTNAAAIRLYESSGFKCIKREPWQGSNGDTPGRLTYCRVFGEATTGLDRVRS